jgi:hypothetical protein
MQQIIVHYSVMCIKNQHLGCDMQQEKSDITAIYNKSLYFHMGCASKTKHSGERYVTENSETNIQVKTK